MATTKKTSKKDTAKTAAVKTTKKSSSGKLGQVRDLVSKALKSNEWEANLDPKSVSQSRPHLPTGSMIIDYLIGGKPNDRGVSPCPGIPKGRIFNLYGHESSGKSTLALTVSATTCKNGGVVGYIDWEHEIVPDYAMSLGVPISDPDRFMLCQPDTLDDGVAILWTMASAGVDLIVLDSVGAGVPKKFFEKSIAETAEQGRVGMNAAVWSSVLPKIKGRINRTQSAVIGISQIRASISTGPSSYGEQTTVQGGNAWKFYSTLRMKLQRVRTEKASDYSSLTNKAEDRVVGAIIKAKLDKCKVSSQQGNEELFYIRWGLGIDDLRSLIEIGIAHRVVKKGGAWIEWVNPEGEQVRFQGMEKFRDYFASNGQARKALEKQIRPYMASSGKGSATTADTDDEVFDEVAGIDDNELKEILGSISGGASEEADSD